MKTFYYGWVVVAAAATIFTLVLGSTFSVYGLFVLPVSEEFNLSRANANTGVILLNTGSALLSPFLGRLLDRVSARRLIMLSGLMFAASLAIISRSSSIWLDAAVLALMLSFACKGAGTLTAPLLVVRWFTVQRGRATAIAQLGMSLGGLLLPPVVGFLIETTGWRNALLITGVGAGAAIFAIGAAIRERPGPGDREVAAAPAPASATGAPSGKPDAGPMKLGAILSAPEFWIINIGCSMASSILTAVTITLAPLGREQGLSVVQAATLISAMAACGVCGKLVLAAVADRIDKIVLLTIVFLLGAVVNAGLMVSDGHVQLLIAAGSLGLVGSAVLPMKYALLADRFGSSSFGTVAGFGVPVSAVIGIVAVRYAGEVFDRTGGYDLLFVTFVVVEIAAALAILALRFTAPRPALARS